MLFFYYLSSFQPAFPGAELIFSPYILPCMKNLKIALYFMVSASLGQTRRKEMG